MKRATLSLVLFLMCALVHAAPGTEAGITLIQPYGARAAALGEAISSLADDVSSFAYNPAAAASFTSNHASLSFQQGLADDSFNHALFGMRTRNGGVGLALGHYDGGEIRLEDRTVNAQRDLMVGIGFAKNVGALSVGVTGKYLSSTLGETYSASAYAADFGISSALSSKARFSAALQNYGTKLKFQDEGDDLPRMLRAGMSYSIASKYAPTLLMLDIPYSLNLHEAKPSFGVETRIGPLALRAGYRMGSRSRDLSLGTGFMMGKTNLDYSFGLIDNTNTLHRVSFSLRFSSQQQPLKEQPTHVIFDSKGQSWPETEDQAK